MFKLLQIVVEGNTGSTGTIAESIGNYAIQQGWDSCIAYGRFPRPSTSHLLRIGSNFDVLVHGIKTRLFDKHGFGSKHATEVLIKKIEYIKPDLIQLHHLHGYYINIEVLFKYLSHASMPVVWTFHDCWAVTGHCCHFDHVQCDRWMTECKKCPQKKEYPASLFIDRSTENYYLKKGLFTNVRKLAIVSPSFWLKNIIGQSFLGGVPTQVIHNGINTLLFKPKHNSLKIREMLGLGERFIILGVASTWSKRKGLNDFVDLSRRLNKNEVIVLVGLNQTQIKQIPKNIIGLKKTENRQMLVDIYSAADLFVNPTYEDNFPTTNIEALSCGTPVATYRTGGSVEAVSMDTGFIVEKGDIDSLIDCIRIVSRNEKQTYSNNCRSRALSLFSNDIQFAKYFELYQNILNEKYVH